MHDHNEQPRAGEIAARAAGGESFAVISDAGMPGVSDPGYRLIQPLKEKGVIFTVLPGPSAVVTALVGSGLPTDAFFFGGFLPVKSGKKNAVLQTAVEASHTSIFYESPHRIVKTVQALAALDPDMWTDLMGLNAPALSQVIRRLEENLHAYRIALDNRDRERLHAKLTYSSNRKRRINLPGSGQIPLSGEGSAKR